MTAVVPAPPADAVREAFARAGTNRAAALVLGVNYRTLERQLRADAALHAAAKAGREAHNAEHKVPPHGTLARYARELAAKVPTCDACRAANATYQRGFRAAR